MVILKKGAVLEATLLVHYTEDSIMKAGRGSATKVVTSLSMALKTARATATPINVEKTGIAAVEVGEDIEAIVVAGKVTTVVEDIEAIAAAGKVATIMMQLAETIEMITPTETVLL